MPQSSACIKLLAPILAGLLLELPAGCASAPPPLGRVADMQPSSALPTGQQMLALTGRLRADALPVSLAQTEVALENTAYRTQTDGQGSFAFENLPAGPAPTLVAEKTLPDGTRYAARQPLSPGLALDSQSLLLTQAGSIYGSVTADGLQDLTGINVFIAGTPMGALTSADGSWFISNVPAGSYAVTALKDGYQPVQGTVTVESGKPVQLTLVLKDKLASPMNFGNVSGQVVGSAGPVAGVSISLAGESYAATTDKDGRYRLSNVLPQAHYTMRIQREGFAYQEQEIAVAAGQAVVKDIQLKADAAEPAGTLKGTLLDSSGQPVAGATVQTEPASRTVTTQADGSFVIPGILPGSYYLTGTKDGQLKGSRFVGVDPAQTVDTSIMGPAINGNNNVCDQQNINNIHIDIPGAQVTVVVDNHNDCRIEVSKGP